MTSQKIIILDSSTLISLSMNGLFEEFKKLKSIFKGKFIITEYVKREIIDIPIKIKRFELEALKIKKLLDEKIVELPNSVGVKDNEISKKTNEILDIANSIFLDKDKNIHIIDLGEASCLALGKILNENNIVNVIAIDERTTRMLSERPENLKKLLEKKLHTNVSYKKEKIKFFNDFKIIRSAELVYIAYKKGLVDLNDGNVLDALLYAVKFKGCSISDDEIREIKKL